MKSKILLSLLIAFFVTTLQAQKNQQKTTAYAITAAQKGNSSWGEVRLIDVNTGEELKTVYSSNDQVEPLNARTKKPIVKKDVATSEFKAINVLANEALQPEQKKLKVYRFDNVDKEHRDRNIEITRDINDNVRRIVSVRRNVQTDKPFSTNSAACAYDKKHERLYYTPMGIAELRYIDLRANTPSIYYFEGEKFGVVSGPWDVRNQITRMAFASDGTGYALSNDANHLIQFTTKKKAEIADLGELTDDAANGRYSVHNPNSHGGDMIADDQGKLYLITANRAVFKIDPQTKIAQYKGSITGLPGGYSTNGAVVEAGTTVVVSSANSVEGYYKFDINSLQAEKISNNGNVFNASDLANSTLLSEKKKDKQPEETLPVLLTDKRDLKDALSQNALNIFPNPAPAGSVVKLSFSGQPSGRYTIQFMEISGKVIETRQVTIGSKMQVEDLKLPTLMSKGNYVVKVTNEAKKLISVNNIIVR